MQRYSGEKYFQIWLIGDSNPKNWQDKLDTPLDPRHPARHSIWTPILEEIQDTVFREQRRRVDSTKFYVQNAIENPQDKPQNTSIVWADKVMQEVELLRRLFSDNKPPIIISFGAFAFEFSRRALGEKPIAYNHWGALTLGNEFRMRLNSFRPHTTNLFPLLHTSISRGRFLSSHRDFCEMEGANYFEIEGRAIGHKLIEYQENLQIWIE